MSTRTHRKATTYFRTLGYNRTGYTTAEAWSLQPRSRRTNLPGGKLPMCNTAGMSAKSIGRHPDDRQRDPIIKHFLATADVSIGSVIGTTISSEFHSRNSAGVLGLSLHQHLTTHLEIFSNPQSHDAFNNGGGSAPNYGRA